MNATIGTDIPPPGNFWNRPSSSDVGDSTADVLYQRVGVALSQWENVEHQFATLFSRFMSAESIAAERVFGTINGVHGRVAALNAAAEVAFRLWKVNNDHQTLWRRLTAHYIGAAERRNDIAHAIVIHVSHENKDCGIFLMPPFHATKKRELIWDALEKEELDSFGAAYRYTSSDIDAIRAKFAQLWKWAIDVGILFMRDYVAPRSASQK